MVTEEELKRFINDSKCSFFNFLSEHNLTYHNFENLESPYNYYLLNVILQHSNKKRENSLIQKIGDIKNSTIVGCNISGDGNTVSVNGSDKKESKVEKSNHNKAKDINHNRMFIILFSLVFITLVISITSLCLNTPKYKELGFDYTGIIVGVLSLLVTILVGWQIYMYLTMQDRLKKDILSEIDFKLNNFRSTISKEQDDKLQKLEDSIGAFLLQTKGDLLYEIDRNKNIGQSLDNYIRSVSIFLELKEDKYAELILNKCNTYFLVEKQKRNPNLKEHVYTNYDIYMKHLLKYSNNSKVNSLIRNLSKVYSKYSSELNKENDNQTNN